MWRAGGVGVAWSRRRPSPLPFSVLARADAAAAAETDPASRAAARKLARKLRAVSDELRAYDATLADFIRADPSEWEPMVAARRADLPAAFFEHCAARLRGLPRELARARRELSSVATRLAALVSAFDGVTPEAAAAAAAEMNALLTCGSMAEAEARIDALAGEGKLDPALMMVMAKVGVGGGGDGTPDPDPDPDPNPDPNPDPDPDPDPQAYAASKESDYTRDDAKEVMVHLWKKAQESFQREQPVEMRVVRKLLSLEGDVDLRSALAAAFDPGPAVETADEVFLSM